MQELNSLIFHNIGKYSGQGRQHAGSSAISNDSTFTTLEKKGKNSIVYILRTTR